MDKRWEVSLTARRLAAALGCCAGVAAQAQTPEGSAFDTAAQAAAQGPRAESAMRLEVKASALPRLDAQDNGFGAPRVDLSLLPPERSALGPAVGVRGFTPPAAAPIILPGFAPQQRPGMDVGLHLRHTLESNHQIDITAWRRMDEPQSDAHALALRQQRPLYGARVELNLSPTRKTGFTADRGFIGVQLDGGARITLKRKDGRPMLYYRNQF